MAKAEKRIARLKGAYDHLATRTDIERLRSELEEDTERLKSEVKVDIESLRAELRGVKWFIGAGIAAVGIAIPVLNRLPGT